MWGKTIKDEGGKTKEFHHTITLDSGVTLKFSERNIFDFGVVINPRYIVAPGMEPGGLANVTKDGKYYWMEFYPPKYKVDIDGKWMSCTSDEQVELARKFFKALPSNVRIIVSKEPSFFGDDNAYYVSENEKILRESRSTSPEGAIYGYFFKRYVKLVSGGGWDKVRDMHPEEEFAYRYLDQHGMFSRAGVRMYTDTAISEEERVAHEEAALELAVEEGWLPGAMPADI